MPQNLRWLEWARELQAVAQIGLTDSKDPFDIERFHRIREISVEIMHEYTVEAEMVTCEEFVANSETSDRGFFAVDEIHELSLERVNLDQIGMYFKANGDSQFSCVFD